MIAGRAGPPGTASVSLASHTGRMGPRTYPIRPLHVTAVPNPFENGAELSDEPRQWAEEAAGLLAAAHVLLLVGDEGLGKTARLRALEVALKEGGYPVAYCYLPPGVAQGAPDRLPEPCEGVVYLVDEADRLRRGRLRDFARRCREREARLAVAAHRDLGRELRAAGWEVARWRLRGFATAEGLREAVQAVLDRAGPGPQLSQAAAERLLRLTRGNYRLVWALMYQAWEDWDRQRELGPQSVAAAAAQLRAAAESLGARLRSRT